MLRFRHDLGLTAEQVQTLERLRADFAREASRRQDELRAAERDLAALLETDPVDLGAVESKIRDIERLRGDLRLGRIRTIEQGRALLTPAQRERLRTLLGPPAPPVVGGPWPWQHGGWR
jgi:Spy/CpxP family protein refolding chaperone